MTDTYLYSIDSNKYFSLKIHVNENEVNVSLVENGQTNGHFAENFGNQAEITINGKICKLSGLGRSISYHRPNDSAGKDSIDLSIAFNGQKLADLTYEPKRDKIIEHPGSKKFSVYQTRIVANDPEYNDVIYSEDDPELFKPKTDLHTHYPGILTGEKLVDVAMRNAQSGNCVLEFEPSYLKKQGVVFTKQSIDKQSGKIPITKLSHHELTKLAASLSFKPDEINTFSKMEDNYAARDPFVKNIALFPDMLREIANDYKMQGVDYAELSFNKILDPKFHAVAASILSEIEEKTGVRMTFLVGLSRHQSNGWFTDKINQTIELADSPYISGVDFLARESNDTKAFVTHIDNFYKYAESHDDKKMEGFTVRVHAGETPKYPDNVKDSLSVAYEHIFDKDGNPRDNIEKLPMMRIGHGIYGLDNETIALAKKLSDVGKLVIEINPDSNLTLNNISNINELPLNVYAEAGVNMVLASDSTGMYRTTLPQVSNAARGHLSAETDYDAMKMILQRGESVVMDHTRDRQDKKRQALEEVALANNTDTISKEKAFCAHFEKQLSEVPKVYTEEVEEAEKQRRNFKIGTFQKVLESQKITVCDSLDDIDIIKGKTPILLGGGGFSNLPPEEFDKIKQSVRDIVTSFDPEQVYFITTAKNSGTQGLVIDVLEELEKTGGAKYTHIAALNKKKIVKAIDESLSKDGDRKEDMLSTAQKVVNDSFRYSQTTDAAFFVDDYFDYAQTVSKHVTQKHGVFVAYGGFTNDRDQKGNLTPHVITSDMVMAIHGEAMNHPEYDNSDTIFLANDLAGPVQDKTNLLKHYHYGHESDMLAKDIGDSREELMRSSQLYATKAAPSQKNNRQTSHQLWTSKIASKVPTQAFSSK